MFTVDSLHELKSCVCQWNLSPVDRVPAFAVCDRKSPAKIVMIVRTWCRDELLRLPHPVSGLGIVQMDILRLTLLSQIRVRMKFFPHFLTPLPEPLRT